MRRYICLVFLVVLIFKSYCTDPENKVGTYSVIAYLHSARQMGIESVVCERKGEKILKYLKEIDEIDKDITSIIVDVPEMKKIKTFTFVRDGKDWLKTSVDRKTKKCTIL
ncbi:hypothetical protein HYX58_02850 [Candidatus Dependentiae bacterium]|nr:hypothetical protein [Candidatus Dependentiae bacterium]